MKCDFHHFHVTVLSQSCLVVLPRYSPALFLFSLCPPASLTLFSRTFYRHSLPPSSSAFTLARTLWEIRENRSCPTTALPLVGVSRSCYYIRTSTSESITSFVQKNSCVLHNAAGRSSRLRYCGQCEHQRYTPSRVCEHHVHEQGKPTRSTMDII